MEAKKSSTRGSSFSPHIDAAVAKAYIKTSEDPILGTDRQKKVFFETVAKLYNDIFKPANRITPWNKSIRNRVRLLGTNCTLFSGC